VDKIVPVELITVNMQNESNKAVDNMEGLDKKELDH
jgi:hypothetical protein